MPYREIIVHILNQITHFQCTYVFDYFQLSIDYLDMSCGILEGWEVLENHTEDLLLSHWGQHNVLPIRYILLGINCWGCTYSFVPLVRFTVNKHYWQVYCERYTYIWCYIKNCYKGFTSKHFLGVITVRNVCWPMQPSPLSNPWGTDYWPDLPLWIFWRLGQTGTAQI